MFVKPFRQGTLSDTSDKTFEDAAGKQTQSEIRLSRDAVVNMGPRRIFSRLRFFHFDIRHDETANSIEDWSCLHRRWLDEDVTK